MRSPVQSWIPLLENEALAKAGAFFKIFLCKFAFSNKRNIERLMVINLLPVLAFAAALLPVGLLMFYILRKDSLHPEPPKWLWLGGLFGVCSAFVALGFDRIFYDVSPLAHLPEGTVAKALSDAFLSAAIPEESAKLLMLWLLLRKNPYFDEYFDGIVYAACIGLGFAGFENILYLFENINNLASVALMRGLFSVPGHFFFAVTMGYYYSLAHFCSTTKKQKTKYMLLAILVPILLHGIFDGTLMISDTIPAISGILVILFVFFCHMTFKAGRKKIARMKTASELMA